MGSLSKGAIERLKLHVFEGKTSVQVFSEMYKELTSDLERAKNDASSDSDQYHRRAYLRSLFSYSEAILFRLKQHLLDQRDVLKVSITENEKLILDEQKVEMQSDGTLQRKDLMPAHKNNVMFTLKFIARKLELQREPDFGDNGWRSYCDSLDKRHSLTHPKFPGDLQISNDELTALQKADEWLQIEFANIFQGFASRTEAVRTLGSK
jgi:hypothetical protein